tara:strand:+ start:1734 stop:1904 length:171 start_codon:yes stop_codon:yes gene_type:complete
MKTYELTPVNGRKSFYGKCEVREVISIISEGKFSVLKSYDTDVAKYNHDTKEMDVY